MIARTHRFHGLTSLRPVYTRGQTARGQLLTVKYMLNPRRDSYRAAVVVSRKVHKSAVVRNRIRRRMYEIIRGLERRIEQPYDIVITVYSDAIATMPAEQLQPMVEGQLRKARILKTAPARSHAIVEAKEHL